MAACPNKNSEEWRYLVRLAGEETAYKIFIANGDKVPSMGDSARIFSHMNAENYLKKESDLSDRILRDSKLIDDPENSTNNTYRKGAKSFQRLTSDFIPKFFNRKPIDQGETFGERKAKQVWEKWGHDPNKVLEIDGEDTTRQEYAEKWDKLAETARAKGTIIHGIFQMLFETDPAKRNDIGQKIQQIGEKAGIHNPFETFSWLLKTDKDGNYTTARSILNISGINVLENIDNKYKDKVHAEVKVVNEDMGIGTAIDTLVEHHDGYFSIVEWKTGKSFASRLYNRILKYGDQRIDILDNPREHAKLQAMLQAVILKANNPEIKFRHLRTHWVPNEFQAKLDDPYKDVEVRSYLKMIEQFLRNEMPDAYKEMSRKSPDLFKPEEYGAPSLRIVDQLSVTKDDTDTFLRKKFEELTHLRNHNPNNKNDHAIKVLTSEIADLVKDSNTNITLNGDGILNATEADALGIYKKLFGHTGSIKSPIVQLWAKFFKSRKRQVQEEVRDINNRFKALVEPIRQEYLEGGKNVIDRVSGRRINLINHDNFYNFMWKGHRFVTKNDAEYHALDKKRQKLIDFVNDTIYGELSKTMNKTAYVTLGGKEISFLDIYRQGSRAGFELFEGFAPKVPAADTEILRRHKSPKKYFKYMMDSYKQNLKNVVHDESRESHGLDIKYLGNPDIEASENYSRNVEVILDVFVRGLKDKQHLDDVFHFAHGLRDVLAMKKGKDGNMLFSDTIDFIENRIVSDVMGKRKTQKWSQKEFRIGSGTPISIDALVRQAKHKVGWTIMWMKPISGTANGLFTGMVNFKEGLVGTIAEKFHGIEGTAVDFTVKDLANAHKDWLEMQKDSALGKIRENKTWLMARHLKYLPDNFDFANRTDEYSTKSNPILEESSFYAAHTIWEEWISELLMVSMMRRMKLKDGRSIWDAYEVQDVTTEEGATYKDVVWKGGVRGVVRTKVGDRYEYQNLEGLTWHEIEHMKRIYERIHGAYRKEERTSIEVYSMGEAIMQYKKYMPSILNNLFDSTKDETYLGDWKKVGQQEVRGKNEDVYEWMARKSEGRARTFYKFLIATSGMNKLWSPETAEKYQGYKWSELSNEQKKGIINMYTTGAMYMILMSAYFYTFRDTDDEDSYKRLSRRIIDNFSQQYNPIDLLRTLRNPPPIFAKGFNTVHGTGQLMFASAMYLAGDREAGGKALTQEGNLRGWKPMQKNIPVLSSRHDIVNFLDNALEKTDTGLRWDFKTGIVFGNKSKD